LKRVEGVMTSRWGIGEKPSGQEHSHDDDSYEERPSASGYDVQHCDAPMQTHAAVARDHIDVVVEGRAPQNEQESGETCLRLASALSVRDRETWTAVNDMPLPAYVDGYVRRESERSLVPVQVTRLGAARRFRSLNTLGKVSSTLSYAEAAEEIWLAVLNKRETEDRSTILALRGQPGVHTVAAVIDEFHQTYGATLPRARYREVWLIGSSPETHFCLLPART
jgi:hypothetical protein